MRHSDGSDPDVIALLMFADAFPPPIFTVFGPVGWVPTLELTVQVRARIRHRGRCRCACARAT